MVLDETITQKTPPTRGHPVDKVVFDKDDGDRVAMLPLRSPNQTRHEILKKTEMAQFEFFRLQYGNICSYDR